MINRFVEDDALTAFNPRIFFPGNGFHQQLQLAAEYAAMIVLITHFQVGFRSCQYELRVRLRDHVFEMGFNLLACIPCAACPDYA